MAYKADNGFQIEPLPIIGKYNRQRFRQFSPEDTANWFVMAAENAKRPLSMYPTMGRAHFKYNGVNQFIFGAQPRNEFKTVKYMYVVVGNSIVRYDSNYNAVTITNALESTTTNIYFTFLVASNIVFACFVDDQKIYVYREDTNSFSVVTDPNAPGNIPDGSGGFLKPGYIMSFGNRIAVSIAESSEFRLSQINLGGNTFDAGTCFTINGAPVFAQEDGIIRQMGVINNTAFIFTDYTTGVWQNTPGVFSGTGVTFPWTKNKSWNWNFGIAAPNSLDISFGYMAFLARNSDGLLQFMVSDGAQPQKISDYAIDVLLQEYTNQLGSENPFLDNTMNGFLYQYENLIFYRVSGGPFENMQILDQTMNANSIEYKFDTKSWNRCIEVNGERNRIVQHVYYNNKHFVTVLGENTIYEMSGKYYFNELRNSSQPDRQAKDAYIAYPFRYERVTPIISQDDYSEFETEYVEIDFVFGDSFLNYSDSPFINAQFLIDEQDLGGEPQYIITDELGPDGQPIYILADGSNTPTLSDNTYNYLFNPHIELWYSDDGGISFNSADVKQFSDMGKYKWRMRWYQLGPSRNRVYKLICVSIVPIVILGGVMNVRRMSGGAN